MRRLKLWILRHLSEEDHIRALMRHGYAEMEIAYNETGEVKIYKGVGKMIERDPKW